MINKFFAVSFCKCFPSTSKSIIIEQFQHRFLSSSINNVPNRLIPVIPKDSIKKTFSRSPGPGGSNADNVATKAEIRFNLNDEWIPNELRPYIIKNYAYRMSKTGEIVINSSKTRTQTGNLKDCFQKLDDMLYSCAQMVIQEERKNPNYDDSKIIDEKRQHDKYWQNFFRGKHYYKRLEMERHSNKKRQRSGQFYD